MTTSPRVTVAGNLTADPTLRYSPRGVAFARFTVASTPRVRDGATDGWRDGDTAFHRCVCFGPLAEHVADSSARGTRLLVHGRLRQRRYDAADGTRRTVCEIVVEDAAPALRFARASVADEGGGAAAGGGPSTEPHTDAA